MTTVLSAQAHITLTTESGQQIEATQVYTMSQLNQRTAQVLDEINASGRPAVVTRHGRFVCLITPLAAGEVESAALGSGPVADEIRSRPESATPLSAEELKAEVDTWV